MADNLAAQLRDSLRASAAADRKRKAPPVTTRRYQVIVRGGRVLERAAITLRAADEDAAEQVVEDWAAQIDATAYVDEVAELA